MPDRPRHRKIHHFNTPLFLGMVALFLALFGAEAWIDITTSIKLTGRPFAEVWPKIEGSWYSAVQAGACLARASYSMLHICLTVFLLAVPLAAMFYTPKLVSVYLRDRVNQAVFALGILAAGLTHWQTTTVWDRFDSPAGIAAPAGWAGFYPAISLWGNVFLICIAWALILPYSLYALRFLSPDVLVERIERLLRSHIRRANRPSTDHARMAAAVHREIVDLGTLVIRAVERSDRDLVLDGVRALGHGYEAYLDAKPGMPPEWFEPEREWFPGLSDEAFRLIREERTWVGHIFLHQLWLTYFAALSRAPDTVGQIATVALGIAGRAVEHGDAALVALTLRVANTMLREAVRRGDATATQDVVRIHRDLLGKLIEAGDPRSADLLGKAADQMRYYHDFARQNTLHDKADVIALSLARLVELVVEGFPLARKSVVAAFEGLTDPPAPHRLALVKSRALVIACLDDAGFPEEARALRTRLQGASADERRAVLSVLEATPTRSEAGREAYGAEPALEFIPEPRRTRTMSVLTALAA